VRLLAAYADAVPELEAQLRQRLEQAGVQVVVVNAKGEQVPAEGGGGDADGGAPLVMLLCPQLFRHADLRAQLVAALQADPEALGRAVRLYTTAVPFDFYLRECPAELRELQLFDHMYDKFPESALLQAAAAERVAHAVRGEGGGRGTGGEWGWVGRMRYAWRRMAAVRPVAPPAERPSTKLLPSQRLPSERAGAGGGGGRGRSYTEEEERV
jgi:hypothetical protein